MSTSSVPSGCGPREDGGPGSLAPLHVHVMSGPVPDLRAPSLNGRLSDGGVASRPVLLRSACKKKRANRIMLMRCLRALPGSGRPRALPICRCRRWILLSRRPSGLTTSRCRGSALWSPRFAHVDEMLNRVLGHGPLPSASAALGRSRPLTVRKRFRHEDDCAAQCRPQLSRWTSTTRSSGELLSRRIPAVPLPWAICDQFGMRAPERGGASERRRVGAQRPAVSPIVPTLSACRQFERDGQRSPAGGVERGVHALRASARTRRPGRTVVGPGSRRPNNLN